MFIFYHVCIVVANAYKATGVRTVTKHANAKKVPAAMLLTVDASVWSAGQETICCERKQTNEIYLIGVCEILPGVN